MDFSVAETSPDGRISGLRGYVCSYVLDLPSKRLASLRICTYLRMLGCYLATYRAKLLAEFRIGRDKDEK
jgi:hypothetical protein